MKYKTKRLIVRNYRLIGVIFIILSLTSALFFVSLGKQIIYKTKEINKSQQIEKK
jgi:hypothetical protein